MSFLPVGGEGRAQMLRDIGVGSIEDLLADIPADVRLKRQLRLPQPLSELEARVHLKHLAACNASGDQWLCFLGGGAYDHFVPSVVDDLSGRSEFYTAYTPYQPEVSQGTLQTIYEFQSLITRLTGMDISNASLYDGGTALAEAVLVANAINGRREIVVSGCLNPMRLAVLRTYLKATGIAVKATGWQGGSTDPAEVKSLVNDRTCCVVIDVPNFFGIVEDCRAIGEIARACGALYLVSVDPISLGILAAPSEYGADIVVGEGQSLGNHLSFGGPYLGFMATKREHIRKIPGRIVGRTVDKNGRACFCLTLQTREQHIRREKATSNICTNEALMALRAAIYLCWLGKAGLEELARLCLAKAVYAQRAFAGRGLNLEFRGPFFKEFVIRLPIDSRTVVRALAAEHILAGLPLGIFHRDAENSLLISFTEKRTKAEIDRLVDTMARVVRGEVA